MTDLEWIEKEIEKLKAFIAFPQTTLAVRYEKRLNHLQQIKTILEAWEVVKKHLEYFPSDYWNGIPEDVIAMTSNINRKDYPQIKKALEIENE